MKSTLLVGLLLSSHLFAQTTSTVSAPIVLKPVRDKTLPQIQILEPKANRGSKIVTEDRRTFIVGHVTDAAGIKEARIAGQPVSVAADGKISQQVQLKEGPNDIDIVAQDNAGNLATATLRVWTDSEPPSLQVAEPNVPQMRGMRVVTDEMVVLSGRVFDASGIESLLINGQPAGLLTDSSFKHAVPLREGENTIHMTATDNCGRKTEKEISFMYKKKDTQATFLARRSTAVIIGIDAYRGKWQPLQNAVRDAKSVEDLIRNELHFERIVTLYNEQATRDHIIPVFESLYDSLSFDDNLLVYYSGHGVLDKRTNKGYWVPVDAVDYSISRYVSNNDIQTLLGNLPARHVLIVADACFAGDIFRGQTGNISREDNATYLKEVGQRRSRKALTSGGEEPVLDGGKEGHSVFAYYFLQAIQQAEGPFFDASSLYERLRIPVTNYSTQVPQYQAIKGSGDEGGEFIFVKK